VPLAMPVALFALTLLPALAYAALMALCLYGWRRLEDWEIPKGYAPKTRITLLVPARNEAARITECLNSLLACRYPPELLEILVLDDHSDDDTAAIATWMAVSSTVPLRVLRLAEQPGPALSGKKSALALGVSRAQGELIATTDADCLVPPDWLLLATSLYETRRPGVLVGPVAAHRESTVFQRFQALDWAGMAGITGAGIALGGHRIGNGANLFYPKAVFEAVGGYAGNADRASGDDVFLVQKTAQQYPVVFLKNPAAAVRTEVCPDLRAFVQQRLRWGTKNTALPESGAKAALAVVYLCCVALVLTPVLFFFLPALLWSWCAQVALKAVADYVLLREMCLFFDRRELLRVFWPAFFLHTAYIAGVGTASLFVQKYVWKGRRVR